MKLGRFHVDDLSSAAASSFAFAAAAASGDFFLIQDDEDISSEMLPPRVRFVPMKVGRFHVDEKSCDFEVEEEDAAKGELPTLEDTFGELPIAGRRLAANGPFKPPPPPLPPPLIPPLLLVVLLLVGRPYSKGVL